MWRKAKLQIADGDNVTGRAMAIHVPPTSPTLKPTSVEEGILCFPVAKNLALF